MLHRTSGYNDTFFKEYNIIRDVCTKLVWFYKKFLILLSEVAL